MHDVTIRMELRYSVPHTCESVHDVLALVRTPAWVRLVMWFAAPRIKEMSPSSSSVLTRLEHEWHVHPSHLAHGTTACTLCTSDSTSTAERNEWLTQLPCGHVYHLQCIRSWLQQHSACPSCRYLFSKALTGKYTVQRVHSALVRDAALTRLFDSVASSTHGAYALAYRRVHLIVTVRLQPAHPSAVIAAPPCEVESSLLDTCGEEIEHEALATSPTSVTQDLPRCGCTQELGDRESDLGEDTVNDQEALDAVDFSHTQYAPRLSVLESPQQHSSDTLLHVKRPRTSTSSSW